MKYGDVAIFMSTVFVHTRMSRLYYRLRALVIATTWVDYSNVSYVSSEVDGLGTLELANGDVCRQTATRSSWLCVGDDVSRLTV